jgi:hypothetical protein
MSKISSKTSKKIDFSKININTSRGVFIAVILCILASAFIPTWKFEIAIEVVLVLITGYFVFDAVIRQEERQQLIETTNDNLKNLIEHVGIMTIIKSPEEYYKRLKSSIESAQDSVRLLYLTKYSPIGIGKASQDYWSWFQEYAQKSNNVVIKRIASLDSEDKAEWIIDKTLELATTPNYAIRVYDPRKVLPLIGAEIIDGKEIFLFGPHGKTPRWIYIGNPDVAEGMTQYFEELWSKLSEYEVKALGNKNTTTRDSITACIKKCNNENQPA